ncbi:MAG: RdgB/HAM1 family non-canonical purine NTP pyrophosphatase [Lachnospiraceae bacterium]|nr:RdgB/HAM1 family non-canonical purine NTP pyrophosphatase [Lachnospiraceae bacterium]
MKIIFMTGNAGKLREIKALYEDLGLEILTMKEAGIEAEIEEDGATFAENALIKARAAGPLTDAIIMGEDSGLEIDALLKLPGIYSARFLAGLSYDVINKMLSEKLKTLPEEKRTARFVADLAAVFPDGTEDVTEGVIEGRIAEEPAGENGFGYDPVFYVPELGKTTAQVSMEEKSRISHRGQALRKMKPIIRKWIEEHEDFSCK